MARGLKIGKRIPLGEESTILPLAPIQDVPIISLEQEAFAETLGNVQRAPEGALPQITTESFLTQEEAEFHALQAEYWTISKAERDSAATGSELNQQLVRLQQYPSELLELKLVGVGKILTGIFALLFVIGIFLFMMPFRISGILRQLHHEMKMKG